LVLFFKKEQKKKPFFFEKRSKKPLSVWREAGGPRGCGGKATVFLKELFIWSLPRRRVNDAI